MDFQYIGYTIDKKLVKGTLVAVNQDVATVALTRLGYQVLSLKPVTAFMPSWDKLFPSLFQIKPATIILFSRQLALLLESGTDIVTSLELLQVQVTNRSFKRVLGQVVSDLRAGNRLSVALSKHPDIFSPIYCRSLSVGEQTGGLETVLRRTADHMERDLTTKKKTKGALAYPAIVSIVAVIVVAVLVTFVLPSFINLYTSLGADVPLTTRLLLSLVNGLQSYGLYLLVILAIIVFVGAIYLRTPAGRYQKDKLALKLPLVGQVNLLNELTNCCRSMSLLFSSGLPLTEIMDIVIESTNNKAMAEALSDVQQDMVKGEGLSKPMAKNSLFLPMMVQMVRVGEETGTLDTNLDAVAQTYETESNDRTRSLIGFIQPALTLFISLVVAFIAISMLSAMYAIYGQI